MKTLTTFVVAVLMAAPAACDAVPALDTRPALDRINWAATGVERMVVFAENYHSGLGEWPTPDTPLFTSRDALPEQVIDTAVFVDASEACYQATDDEGRVAHWWSQTREVAEGPCPPLDQDG